MMRPISTTLFKLTKFLENNLDNQNSEKKKTFIHFEFQKKCYHNKTIKDRVMYFDSTLNIINRLSAKYDKDFKIEICHFVLNGQVVEFIPATEKESNGLCTIM